MGIATLVGRFILMALNTVFVIAGSALIIAGVIIRYLGDEILNLIKPIVTQMNSFSSVTGFTLTLDTSSSGFNIVDILQTNSTYFIAVGTILAAVAIFGCVGACCGLRILLFVYGILLAVIVLIQILAIAIVAAKYDDYRNVAVKFIKERAVKEYHGTNSSDVFSLLVNCVQMNLKCCGVTDYKDWQATAWDKSKKFYPFELNIMTTGMPTPYQIPVACCVMKEPYPSFTPTDVDCAKTPTKDNSYFEKPCFTFIEDKIKSYKLYAILATCGLLLVQVLIMAASFIIWKKLGKD